MIYDETQALHASIMIYLPSHNVISRSQTSFSSHSAVLIFLSLYISPLKSPSAQSGASRKTRGIFFPFLEYRAGGYENIQFNVQNKRIALYFGLAASSKQFRGCRSFSPGSLPPSLSLLSFSLSLRCSIHRRAYTIYVHRARPQIALSHCCCPVVRTPFPAVAGDQTLCRDAP